MKTYNDIFNFNGKAILEITIITSISNNSYLFNIHIQVFDTNLHTDQKLESLYSSSFSIESTEKQAYNSCLEHSIYHRVIAADADAAFNNTTSFNVQEFQDYFASEIFNMDSVECSSLEPFKLVSYEQYVFERDLDEPEDFCCSVREVAIKYELTYKKRSNILLDFDRASRVLGLDKQVLYKAYSKTTNESIATSRIVKLTDILLASNNTDEANKLMAIINEK
ncbi:hypothetical protein AB6E39_06890 [Vibrio splendidus]|uniref:hypothetical protein n=1 Tax=Vibrio splendidus TaxID=29497 RepID=UPI001E36BCAC|nr:hypothetical protein [Vibrio splendidus]MCC4787701.1 hypothetical protein [Vibrio splendidus]